MKRQRSQFGQGLLETIIGIGVIVAGTVGSITLIMQTVKFGRATNNRVTAASLAREGIEVVRNIRDTNWLKIQANEETYSFRGLFDGANPLHDGIPIFTQTSGCPGPSCNSWSFQTLTAQEARWGPVPPPALCPPGTPTWDCKTVFENASGYAQTYAGPTPGIAGKFRRLVRLDALCREDLDTDGWPDSGAVDRIENNDTQTCHANEVLVGLLVRSEVRWDESGITRQSILEDKLYNWKYVK